MPSPEQWVEILAPHDRENERHAMAMFAILGNIPSNYLDVGCGTGAFTNLARKLGVDAYGIDVIPRPEAHFLVHDLRKPFAFKMRFQCVSCIEVAEHIDEKEIGPLLYSCARHVEVGGWLVWSAAHPGQGGDGHATLWTGARWRSEFHRLGLTWDERRTLRLAAAWRLLETSQMWLAENVQCFFRDPPPPPSLEPEEE